MTITYTIGRGLYLNITNRCSNNCAFCIRNNGDEVSGSGSLWLEREPSRDEILDDILKYDLTDFDEIVFCGYGEPTERLGDLIWVAKKIKENTNIKIRVNTNGHASLINGYDVTPLFEGAVDVVSISLNTPNADEYIKICRPEFGQDGYYGMLDFAGKVQNYVADVYLSVVKGTIHDDEILLCQQIADDLGVKLRVRGMA